MSLYILDLLGVAVFAASGALAASRKGLDLLGVVVLGMVTAIGGGTIRDVILGRHPIFWLEDPAYVVVILAASLITVAYVRWRPAPEAALLVADAFGLAFFTIAGAQVAQRAGVSPFAVVLMATMTGVAGGVVRDVLCAEIPIILRHGDIYATASIAGAMIYVLLPRLGSSASVAAVIGVVLVMVLRLVAIALKLRLPVVSPRHK